MLDCSLYGNGIVQSGRLS